MERIVTLLAVMSLILWPICASAQSIQTTSPWQNQLNINDGDVAVLLNHWGCIDHGDLNPEEGINHSDVVHIINYIYKQLDAPRQIAAVTGGKLS